MITVALSTQVMFVILVNFVSSWRTAIRHVSYCCIDSEMWHIVGWRHIRWCSCRPRSWQLWSSSCSPQEVRRAKNSKWCEPDNVYCQFISFVEVATVSTQSLWNDVQQCN